MQIVLEISKMLRLNAISIDSIADKKKKKTRIPWNKNKVIFN